MESTICLQNAFAGRFVSEITVKAEAPFDAWQTAEWWIHEVLAGQFTARFANLID